jgi:hypothetical protein
MGGEGGEAVRFARQNEPQLLSLYCEVGEVAITQVTKCISESIGVKIMSNN